jgi:hypothetical protein
MPAYAAVWAGTAACAVICTGVETFIRTRRMHSGFVGQMMYSAAEQFLPAVAAGLFLTLVMLRFAPRDAWLLPGLWQLFFSLGVFASCRFLPRSMFAVGVWYLACGLGCLVLSSAAGAMSPWEMGLPFGVGQLGVAAVLRFGRARDDERAAKLVSLARGFDKGRPQTVCRLTAQGRKRYLEYLAVLEQVVLDAAAAVKGETLETAPRSGA